MGGGAGGGVGSGVASGTINGTSVATGVGVTGTGVGEGVGVLKTRARPSSMSRCDHDVMFTLSVRLIFEDQIPVADVGAGGKGVATQSREFVWQKEGDVRQHTEDEHDDGGKEATGAPHPERTKVDAAGPVTLADKEAGEGSR